MDQVQVLLEKANGDGQYDFVLKHGANGFSGTINPAYPYQRESFVKSALGSLGLPIRDVATLGMELFRLSQQHNGSAGKHRLPEIEDAFDLCERDIALPPELIQGLLHQGSKLSFGGASKGFKTWVLDYLALAVAYGLPWLGCKTRRSKVFLIDMELQKSFCRRRLITLENALGIQRERGWLDVWNLRGYTTGHSEIFPRIIERIGENEYGLIILDPIYKLYGNETDENTARDVAALMNSIESLTFKTGAAAAFGSHFSKGNQANKNAIDRVSGSGVFRAIPTAC